MASKIPAKRAALGPRPSVPPALDPARDPARNGFSDILRDLTADRNLAIDAIRAGFAASLLKDAALYFNVSTQRIRAIARLPETTAHTLIKRGAKLDAAASKRIWRLADLMTMAREVFEDEESAKIWLRTPNLVFQDVAPIEYLDTEPGAMAVRQVLNTIAIGGAL
ncbi:putative toxin-antitoxin system antitoxin component (TIGR02293 family) [Duganella sp. 1411]|uniref:antitoxin Xre/MbcA/ParS toxin-binding domain-containing protein n=1 Tax=Duganella sp. 1411 TaxID=2806572 RepID=UPI001AE9D3EB|nr:antitoxin Xre/MbcA/ParS toxin-binding domain-containing protein [Duganella sp. 1411]MBP1204786.1 putative toxin-antitoxin system antitoxin component (TIGR02293 family) [Duganella sp. 1411]